MGSGEPDISFGVILPVGRRRELIDITDPVAKWDTTVTWAVRAEAHIP